MLLPLSCVVNSGFLKSTGKNFHFGKSGCLLPVTTENVCGIVNPARLKQEKIDCWETIDDISEEVLCTQHAEFRLHLPQVVVSAVDFHLLSFGFAFRCLFKILFPFGSFLRPGTQNLQPDVRVEGQVPFLPSRSRSAQPFPEPRS